MGSTDVVMVSDVDEAECSETTVEIKIKTLDSQTYTLRVNKRVPVPELKAQIAIVTGVLSDQQRLICRGKVLKDDQLLSAYHVEDGHTLHMVVRQPLPPSSGSTDGTMGSDHSATDPAASAGPNHGLALAHSILLGSFNVADQGEGGVPDLNRIVSAVLDSIGMTGPGSSANGLDNGGFSVEAVPESIEIPSGAAGISSTGPHLHFDPLRGAFGFPSSATLAPMQPLVIPDSLTTLSQYLSHLRNEFIAMGGSHNVDAVNDAVRRNENREQNSTLPSSAGQIALPTAASLADFVLSTRQMLVEQVARCLSELARQLEDQTNVTAPSLRGVIQSSAMRTGVLLQNLGALLLELGRTTMTLRIGPTTSDTVVNAGPAVFISATGPNPIMVQPLPFQPGASVFGAPPLGTVSAGSALSSFLPRNIDIRIRTGSSMNTSTENQGEQTNSQQTPGQMGTVRDSGTATTQQEGVRVSGGPSLTGQSGLRVIPIRRTVVTAVPAAVARSASNLPGTSAGLLFPLLARVQHVAPTQSTEARGAQPSSEHQPPAPETDPEHIPDSATQPRNVRVTIGATLRDGYADISNLFSARAASPGTTMSPPTHHHYGAFQTPGLRSQDPLVPSSNGQPSENGQQSTGQTNLQAQATESDNSQGLHVGADRHDATPTFGIEDGIFLSRLIREVYPYISQASTTEPSGVLPERVDSSNSSAQLGESPVDAGTSRRHNDTPPTSPSAKRLKRE